MKPLLSPPPFNPIRVLTHQVDCFMLPLRKYLFIYKLITSRNVYKSDFCKHSVQIGCLMSVLNCNSLTPSCLTHESTKKTPQFLQFLQKEQLSGVGDLTISRCPGRLRRPEFTFWWPISVTMLSSKNLHLEAQDMTYIIDGSFP